MKNIDLNNYYQINPAYKFRSDIRRIVLTNSNSLFCDTYEHLWVNYSQNFSIIMHPVVALVFSKFDGRKTLADTIMDIADLVDDTFDNVLGTFKTYIYNDEEILYKLSEDYFAQIPKNFIIEKSDNSARDVLQGIDIQHILNNGIDLTTKRFYIPNEVYLMVTNNCQTDCVYCYADRKHRVKKFLDFNRVKELIVEAHKIGCRDFGIAGGDIFTYPHWPQLIDFLHQNEYNPYISTKIPIGEKEINMLKDLGVTKLQLSLDSICPDTLSQMIKVSGDYLQKMRDTILCLHKNGIEFMVKSVITKYNDSLDSVRKLVKFLLQFDNLHSLSIAPAEASLYKPYIYNSTKEKLALIEKYIIQLSNPKVTMQPYMLSNEKLTFAEKMEIHNNRASCSGNVISFHIMPDGYATICEQTYWHPYFNLGDLSTNSIMEVWTGERAMELWNIQQSDIRSESACKKCTEFEECRRGAGSCWRMAIQAYGMDKYDYPYPQCPYAPPATQPFYIDKTATQEFIDKIHNDVSTS